jgi:hypothetical protein
MNSFFYIDTRNTMVEIDIVRVKSEIRQELVTKRRGCTLRIVRGAFYGRLVVQRHDIQGETSEERDET